MPLRRLLFLLLLSCSACLPVLGQVAPADSIPSGKSSLKGATSTPASAEVTVDSTSGDSARPRRRSIVERNTDPVGIEKDSLRTARKEEFRKSRDPRKAMLLALAAPGAGQAYNHKYWKMPIVWAGFGAFAFFIVDNHVKYADYRDAIRCRADSTLICTDPFPDESTSTLISNREFYRRYRDLNVIFAAVWYTLQTVDAYVDAHMAGFDVSDDLTLQVRPHLQFDPIRSNSLISGFTLNLRLKR